MAGTESIAIECFILRLGFFCFSRKIIDFQAIGGATLKLRRGTPLALTPIKQFASKRG